MGGKSKSVTVGYKYYVGMHHVLCHGPIDYISNIWVDERGAWSGQETGGQITINAPELFGGESREGGVSGTVDIEMGGPAQGQNSYLVSKLGSDVPAYRGVVAAVLRQAYCGNNPYLKAWKYRGSRIHVKGIEGEAQWYDEKALILGETGGDPIATYSVNIDGKTSAATTAAGALSKGVLISGLSADSIIKVRPNYSGSYVAWSPWGSSSRARYSYHVIRNEDSGDYSTEGIGTTHTSYAAARAAHTAAFPTGESMSGAGSYRFCFIDSPTGDNSGGLSMTVDVYPAASIDMNPAHIIRECLTDLDWGMGYSTADIDDASFTEAADTLYSEGLGISLLWDKQIKIDEFVGEIIKHIDGVLYVSRTTGKFVLKLIRGDYDEGSLLSFDESNIIKVANPSRTTFDELANSVTVNYWNAATGKDASLTITDTAMVQQQGVVINTTLQYPGFCNARNAAVAGQRDLRALSSPFFSCTITTNTDGQELNIGDVFKFSWARWGIVDMVMRVTGISFGDGRKNEVVITCAQDVFGTVTGTVISTSGSTSWTDPSAPPQPIPSAEQVAFEASYYELVQSLGQTDIDTTLGTNPEVGYIMSAASRPSGAINARMWIDSGAGYEDAGTLDFCPSATLQSNITPAQTTFIVENMDELDTVTIGSHFQIGDELCRIDSINTTTGELTCGRGCLDTVPWAHSAGDTLFFWDLFNGYSPTEYVAGEELGVKITPASGGGQLSVDSAIEIPVLLAQRAYAPYPPGDLQINSLSYDTETNYDGELTITYAHRDRLQQTSGTIADHTAADIGPEAGTVYRLQGYVNGTLVHTEDDNATTTFLWTPSGDGVITVEVHSKRDAVYSLQGATHSFYYLGGGGVRLAEDGDERYTEDGDVRVTED